MVLPLSIAGGIRAIYKRERRLLAIWWIMIINVASIYVIAYSGTTEPRHKLMFLPAMATMAVYALRGVKRKTIMFCAIAIICAAALLLCLNVL